jgi:hypothetical protein
MGKWQGKVTIGDVVGLREILNSLTTRQGVPGLDGEDGSESFPIPGPAGLSVPSSYLTQTFVSQTTVTVNHNFGSYPVVQIIDNTGEVLVPKTITNTSLLSLTITFDVAKSGTVILTIGKASTQSTAILMLGQDGEDGQDGFSIPCPGGSGTVDLSAHQVETSYRHPYLSNALSTGLLTGGELSINAIDDTQVDIAAGVGIIIDNTTDPINPVRKIVTWPAQTITDPYIATSIESGISIQKTTAGDGVGSVLFQDSSEYTSEQHRDLIILGWNSHVAGDVIETAYTEPYFIPDTSAQLADFLESFGSFNIVGNIYSANALLTIQKSEGQVFDNGTNYLSSKKSPNILTLIPETPILELYYYYRDVAGAWVNDTAATANIDPNNYDKGTGFGLTAVPTDKFTIQTIFFYAPTVVTEIQYGQVVYDTMAAAQSAIQEIIEVNPWLDFDIFRSWLIVKQGTTDLTNALKAKFIMAGKLGLLTGGSGGVVPDITGFARSDQIGAFNSLDTYDGEEQILVPGLQGLKGNPGISGQTIILEPELPEDSIIPGQIGKDGKQGIPGPIIYIEPDQPDDPIVIPGPPGIQGPPGGGGGGLSYTKFTQDLGVARRDGTFDITGLAGLTIDKVVNLTQTADQISSKGNARDEAEMDQIQLTGYVLNATTIRTYWQAPSVVVGIYAFAYAVSG